MAELRFDGRVAIVTGAGRGIGRAHAELLAARGARVVVNDFGTTMDGGGSDTTLAEAVSREINNDGGVSVADASDISTIVGATQLVDTTLAAFGQIDIVVNNAGIIRFVDFDSDDVDNLHRHLAVHIDGSYNVTKAAWPHLVAAGYGRVVNTTSTGVFGLANLVSYGAAKGGVIGLSKALADAGKNQGIKVNALAPLARTRMASGDPSLGPPPDLPPEEASAVMAYLAHESCPVSGEIYLAGGGYAARIFLGEVDGYKQRGLSPEDVRDNWAEINDTSTFRIPADTLEDAGARVMEPVPTTD
jgi:NAD(P)-dependent dehydrogenase (short-subunit alcohol dehydrogenase family)